MTPMYFITKTVDVKHIHCHDKAGKQGDWEDDSGNESLIVLLERFKILVLN